MFKLPREVVDKGFETHFDPSLGLYEETKAPDITPEEILVKCNEWCKYFGYGNISEKDLLTKVEYLSSEVGDDEETASNSKLFIMLQLVYHVLLGVKISLDDTCVSPRFGNFAEDIIVLPDGYGQTYLNARKTGRFNEMSYIDIPKLRLATDIRPMRMDHSGTNDGKSAMVASRLKWIPKNSPIRGTFELFSLYQDLHLGLHRDKKFAYLPSALGGYGKEPPFGNFSNLERFMGAYKNGAHSFLIRNIINRSIRFLERYTALEYPEKDPLLSHIVRFQSSFHDWVKGKSIYAPVVWMDIPPEVAKFQAGKLGRSVVEDEVLIRLASEKKLVTEQQLEIAVEHNELCKALLGAINIKEFQKLRNEARVNFNNLSIFSLENYGMIKELTLDQVEENNAPLRTIEVKYFYELVSNTRFNLRAILNDENVYWPEAMDAIYETGPMKVKFEMFPRNKVGGMSFAAQSSEYKSDFEDVEIKTSVLDLEEWLRGDKSSPVPRTLLNDDNAIIEEVGKSTFNFIITDDIKLCRQAHRVTGNCVIRVPVEWYYKATYFGTEDWTEWIKRIAPGKSFISHNDTGSIQAFEEARFNDGVMLSKPRAMKFSFYKDPNTRDKEVLVEDNDYEYNPGNGEGMIFDSKNLLQRKLKRSNAVKAARGQAGAWQASRNTGYGSWRS